MKANRLINLSVLVGVPALVIGLSPLLTPATAQPASGAQPTQPAVAPKAGEPELEKSEWREKYRAELREHPRLARALVELHQSKEYLEKAPHDFGGHRAEAVKACDEAIKQIKEAIKFDAKHDDAKDHPKADRPAGKK